jgi:hypothetical protein
MKMKKIFKLLMCAAIVAAGFTACSEEVTPIIEPGPGIDQANSEGTPTHATFSFKLIGSAATKALNPDNQENSNVANFRVLIFRSDNTLEVDTVRNIAAGDSLLTIPLQSGTKKIYVYANGGAVTTSAPFTAAGYLTIPATGAVSVLGDINGVQSLVSGSLTPPAYYTDVPTLHTLYPKTSTERFYFSSTVEEAIIGLDPGISAADSKDPNSVNYKNVFLERPVAKVSITKNETSGATGVVSPTSGEIVTRDSTGVITSVQYKIWTVNVGLYPFRNTVNGTFTTPEYIPTSPTDTTNLKNYYAWGLGNGSGNAYIAIANRTTAPPSGGGSYYYIPENNPSVKMKGNTTIAEVQAVFKPTHNHYVKLDGAKPGSGINYNEALTQFFAYPASGNLATASDMYLFIKTGVNGLLENTLFAGPDALKLAKKIYYHLENPTIAPNSNIDAAIYSGITENDVLNPTKGYFIKYTNGLAYYRLNLGEQTGPDQNDYTIKRNYYYDANITGFLRLGDNTARKLIEPINEILEGPTNLSVHIVLRDWVGTEISGDI